MAEDTPQDQIGMTEAAKILQVADFRVARRVLIAARIPLKPGRRRELFASLAAVRALADKRGGRVERGRPRKIPASV